MTEVYVRDNSEWRQINKGATGATGSTGATGVGPFEYVTITGITGATEDIRIVGGTTGIPPTEGTFVTGDVVFSDNGAAYISTTGGTGSWVTVGPWRSMVALTGAADSVTISSIPSTLSTVVIYATARCTTAATGTNSYVNINGSTAAVYYWANILSQSTGSTAACSFGTGATAGRGLMFPGASSATGSGTYQLVFSGWDRGSTTSLSAHYFGGYATSEFSEYSSGSILFASATTYTSVKFTPFSGQFATGSVFMAQGWK